jgi:hypothetical protein
MDARLGGVINATSYSVVGGAFSHLTASEGGFIRVIGGTVAVTGTPAFTQFAECLTVSSVTTFQSTFSGSVTGKRYAISLGGIVNTFGGGNDYFPGNTGGTTATGGQYA